MGTAATVTNWAGNIVFRARRFHRPDSVAELQELVAGSERIRAVGTGHSFSPIADTTADLVSLAGLPPITAIDPDAATVTVSAGLRYGEVTGLLHEAGFALPNLGSLPHISIAGACSTGTHGSGVGNGALATAVSAVDLVGADGELRTVRRGDADFPGSVVALGGLGIVTALTLDLRPTFGMRQWVYEGLRGFDDVEEALASAYSVSLFTYWTGPEFDQVWVKQRDTEPEPPARWLGATRADGPRHMVRGVDPVHCTAQLGEPGPWHERLPHFRLEFTPSSGDELQSEYLIPGAALVDALHALDRIRDTIAPVLQVCEVRSIAADDLWLSLAHDRDSHALHFTWIADTTAVLPVVAAVEAALEPFAARPHWGKVFTTGPEAVRALWPRLPDVERLLRRHDPAGKFRNDMLDHYLPG
ncbi:FAD-binding protein [Pseudonocardia xinjiangensis]|uniref:FAD-binding protein n=1 Tax=Pseudonocardia xinjiangensis TaxID=75289 RepID=UPI003D909840